MTSIDPLGKTGSVGLFYHTQSNETKHACSNDLEPQFASHFSKYTTYLRPNTMQRVEPRRRTFKRKVIRFYHFGVLVIYTLAPAAFVKLQKRMTAFIVSSSPQHAGSLNLSLTSSLIRRSRARSTVSYL